MADRSNAMRGGGEREAQRGGEREAQRGGEREAPTGEQESMSPTDPRTASPRAGGYDLPESPECAFCGGRETELHSPFGSALSVATYWCRECRTAFEWVKWGSER